MIDKSKVTWIDIDAPRKEHTFKDLNCESSGPKFRDLETTDLKTESSEPKSKKGEAFFDSLWGLFQQYRQKRMVNEAVKKSEMWNQFKDEHADSWGKFCEQAKFLAFFLGATDEAIADAIKKLEKVFIDLGKTTGSS